MINDSKIIENSADDEYDMNIFIHDTKKKRYTYICSECNSINHKISSILLILLLYSTLYCPFSN